MMKSIGYYNQNTDAFIEGTIHADMHEHYNRFLPYLPERAHILDLGCGSGRDSLFFIKQGFSVVSVDGSKEVCKAAEKILNSEVRCLRFDELDYHDEFNGIWACASLLHVPKAEIADIMQKITDATKTNGVLYASFKYGDGETIKGNRLFNNYKENEIDSILQPSGFICKEYWISNDVRPNRQQEKWLNIIAIKAQE